VSRAEIVYTVLPFVVLVVLTAGLVSVFRQRAAAGTATASRLVQPGLGAPPRDVRRSDRRWWGSPWVWLGVCAAFVALGIFVWPWLFGGTVVFLPFVWIWRPRREGAMDPRFNGHGKRDGAAPRPTRETDA
jgi:hypothetical protein